MKQTDNLVNSIVEEYNRRMEAKNVKPAKEAWAGPAGPTVNLDAEAEKEIGVAAGASKSQDLVQAAQAVARKLGRNGAVTIDDVVHEMKRMGYANVGTGAKDAPKNWKGSVFSSSEWVCTGSIASRETSAHGRHVRQWCLKSWLREHPVNGTDNAASAFSLFRLYEDARHNWPDGKFVFVIGRNMLAQQFSPISVALGARFGSDGVLRESSKTLYGKDVFIVDGIGAITVSENDARAFLGNGKRW